MMAVIGGVVALLIGIVLLFGGPLFGIPLYMWDDLLVCLKGIISAGLVIGGVLAVVAGISAIKDKAKAKLEENK